MTKHEETIVAAFRAQMADRKQRLHYVADLTMKALKLNPDQTTTSLVVDTRKLDTSVSAREVVVAIYETLRGKQLTVDGDGSVSLLTAA